MEGMARQLDYLASALENAVLEVERVAGAADDKLRNQMQKSQREKASLVRAALRSLQQLRVHLGETLGGLKLSASNLPLHLPPHLFVVTWQVRLSAA